MSGAGNLYWTKIRDLMTATEEVLRAEWPDAVALNTYDLAVCIETLRTYRQHKGQPERRKITPLETSVKKTLAELGARRERLLERVPAEFIEHGYYDRELDEISVAERALAPFLEKPAPYNVGEEMGRRLLATCEQAGLSLSRGKKDRLVTKLLALAGLYRAEATVSEMLRPGRLHRTR